MDWLENLSPMKVHWKQKWMSIPHQGSQAFLQEFAVVFEPPFELPPRRDCDHVIPLVPGAKPMYVSPYRYSPALKDEIEN
jgi:hypothetical protein